MSIRNVIGTSSEHFGKAPLFDPQKGTTIVAPQGDEPSFWAGAPGIFFDANTQKFYLTYRIRRPQPERGVENVISESTDGTDFKPIWSVKKDQLNSPSIERTFLYQLADGRFVHLVSYVDGETQQWRIDQIIAAHPEELDIAKRTPLLTAGQLQVEGVKDPYVTIIGGMYYLIVSYATADPASQDASREALHGTGDAYNTGLIKSRSGLAISPDGINYTWVGDILSPGDSGWDTYCRRINSVLYIPPVFTAFYDGSASYKQNYEEMTGIAVSMGMRNFQSITPEGPVLTSPYQTKCLRYVDNIQFQSEIYYYYEYTRENGSHELRLNIVPCS